MMKAATCTTCGSAVPDAFAKRGRVCPTCLIFAARPPRLEESEPAERVTTRWAESFPQYELENPLHQAGDRWAWAARDLEANRRPVVLQVVSGAGLDEAGGASSLLLRANRLRSLKVPGLACVLDAGELPYAFFLVTERHETWQAVSDGLDPADAGVLDSLLTRASGILAIARQDGLALPFDLATTFRDSATDQLFLTPSALPPDAPDDDTAGPPRAVVLAPGMEVGGFLLEEMVGEGGFGEVWRARQERPVKRTVALKVLKHGLASPRLLARFEVEQQALARLDHPHIARFFHGDATVDGRPFFAMEWIDGESLAHHVEHRALSLPERLHLFTQVGEAIRHAHQKGILHRDLKPSNVMVSIAEGEPTVKVIDFGIARALEDPLSDQTQLTRDMEVLGTPVSMSPEQAAGAELDARSDVYGLGVLLYELLTGQLPFDPDLPADELRRRIREDDPRKPSQCVEPAASARLLEEDLDWITMRCLEKDAERRYSSVSALLEDLERHEKNEPIEAGPPELAYRTKKFVRRNRAAVLAAAAIFLVLVGATVISLKQAAYASSQEHEARKAEATARESAAVAEREKENANRISRFFLELLEGFDNHGPEVKVVDLLDQAVRRLRVDETISPERMAPLWRAVVQAYSSAALAERMAELAAESLRFHEEVLGPDHPGTLQARVQWANSYVWLGNWSEAEKITRDLLSNQLEALPPGSEPVVDATSVLATALRALFRQEEAADLLQARIAVLPDKHPERPGLQLQIARNLADLGRAEESVDLAKLVVDLRRATIGDEHPLTLTGIFHLAQFQGIAHRHEETVALLEAMIPAFDRVFGPDHNMTSRAKSALSDALGRVGRMDEAIVLSEEVMTSWQRAFGPDHPNTLTMIANYGYLLGKARRFDEATELLERALSRGREEDGTLGRAALMASLNLIPLYFEMGETEKAIALSREFREGLIRAQPESGRDVAAEDRPDDAVAQLSLPPAFPGMLVEAMAGTNDPVALPDIQWLSSYNGIIRPLRDEGEYDLAVPLMEGLLSLLYRRTPHADYRHRRSISSLAQMYSKLHRGDDAVLARQVCVRLCDEQLGNGHPTTIEARIDLSSYLRKSGRVAEALGEARRVHALASMAFQSPGSVREEAQTLLKQVLAETVNGIDGVGNGTDSSESHAEFQRVRKVVLDDVFKSALEALELEDWTILRSNAAMLAGVEPPTAYLELCHRIRQAADLAEPEKLPLGRLLLLPPASSQPDLVEAGVAMLEAASATGPDDKMAPINEALVAYRQGSHGTAWSILEGAPPNKNYDQTCMLHLLRAMTAARLGKTDEARDALAVVRPLIDERSEKIANDPGDEGWSQWWYLNLYHHLFFKEAKELIEGSE